MKRNKLRSHQNEGVSFLVKNRGGFLNWDMRLGKTLTVLRSFRYLEGISKVLIVCPYSAMNGWEKDGVAEGFRIEKVIGTRSERLSVLESLSNDLTVFIINKEGFLVVPELMYQKYDAIVIDESHCIKNPTAKITAFYLCNFRYVQYKFCLSGTPIDKNEIDYYTQLKFLGGFEKYSNFYHFRFNCCRPVLFDWVLSDKGLNIMNHEIKKYVSILTLEMAGYEDRHEEMTRTIERSEKFKEVYQKIRDEFILEIDENEVNRTKFASQSYIWLRRICGGFIPDSDELVFTEKFDELVYLLETELLNFQVVIWSSFIQEILFISKKLKNSTYICGEVSISERKRRIEDFKSGIYKYLIAMPQTLSEGANLSNASVNIYYSQPISLTLKKQTKQRIYDTSSKRDLLTINLAFEKTIDESIIKSFQKYETSQDLWKRIIKDLQYENNI